MLFSSELDQPHPLADHSQQSISLLDSRHRMDCEPSEAISSQGQDCEEQMHQFKLEIEQRYKMSISNKIYTFPKILRSVLDIVSSSEGEQVYSQGQPPKKIQQKIQPAKSKQLIRPQQLFKTEKDLKKQTSANEKEWVYTSERTRNVGDKGMTAGNKDKKKDKGQERRRKEEKSSSKEKSMMMKKGCDQLKSQKKKGEKFKTQIEPGNVLSSIRDKVRRN